MSTQISISPVIKLEVNTTPITGGSAGRILFQTTGNTVGESANLFWDDANARLGIGGTPGAFKLDVNGTARVQGNFNIATGFELNFNNQNVGLYRSSNNLRLGGFGGIEFLSSATTIASQTIRMTLFSTGNFAINTTTDAGFRLDVNGTARVQGQFDVISGTANFRVNNSSSFVQLGIGATSWVAYNATESYFSGTQFYFNSGANFRFAGVGQFGFTTNPNASAQVQIDSTTKGFLPPRMTTTQKNAIATPATGLMVYDTDLNRPCFYNGSSWITL